MVWEVFRDSVVCDWVWVSCLGADEAFGDAKFDDSEGGRRGGGGEEEGEGRRRIDGGFEENELVVVAGEVVVFNVLVYTYLFIIVLKTNFDFKKLFLFENARSAKSMLRPSAADLFTVSWYSLSGFESATTPAPACTWIVHSSPFFSFLRRNDHRLQR